MTFKILVSTVDDAFLKRTIQFNLPFIIINQLIHKEYSEFSADTIFSVKEKGLSKSRNRALRLCNSDYALISDDDLVYLPNIEELITNSFKESPDADIITFQIITADGKPFKTYKNKSFIHNTRTIMRVSSVEIAIKVEAIQKNNIQFDERLGLGTNFPTGEEAVFLSDAVRQGLKVIYVPIPIVIHPTISSGGKFTDNPTLIIAKGAMFYRIFGIMGYLVSMIFSFRKYRLSNYSLFTFYKYMLLGIKKYKLELKNDK